MNIEQQELFKSLMKRRFHDYTEGRIFEVFLKLASSCFPSLDELTFNGLFYVDRPLYEKLLYDMLENIWYRMELTYFHHKDLLEKYKEDSTSNLLTHYRYKSNYKVMRYYAKLQKEMYRNLDFNNKLIGELDSV